MQPDQQIQFLEWDSDFFGLRIARVAPSKLTADTATAVSTACLEQQIECLYFLVAPEDTSTIRQAEEQGFHLVDIRVTLERQITANPGTWQSETPDIRLATAADIPALRLIAAANHRDSRFYHDGGFSPERCDELYATWIEKSCKGYADAVLVADCGEGAVGYLSCHLKDNGAGQIGLVGVSSSCQGRGLGKHLLNEALRWFMAAGTSRIEVVTQGRNLTAQRLYQKSGFLTSAMQLWYHKWFRAGCKGIDIGASR